MNSLSKLTNIKSINKSAFLLKKNFCAVTKANELNVKILIIYIYLSQSNETFNKLVQRDFSYFDKLSKQKGRANVLIELESINNNLDLSTKLGRDVLEFSRDMAQKIILHERTIEE